MLAPPPPNSGTVQVTDCRPGAKRQVENLPPKKNRPKMPLGPKLLSWAKTCQKIAKRHKENFDLSPPPPGLVRPPLHGVRPFPSTPSPSPYRTLGMGTPPTCSWTPCWHQNLRLGLVPTPRRTFKRKKKTFTKKHFSQELLQDKSQPNFGVLDHPKLRWASFVNNG